MNKITFLFSVLLLAVVAGCSKQPKISTSEAVTISQDANELLKRYPSVHGKTIIPINEYPSAIKKLQPIEIYILNDGIYIKLKEGFASESGLYVLPNNSSFSPPSNGDPSYLKIHDNVYFYEING